MIEQHVNQGAGFSPVARKRQILVLLEQKGQQSVEQLAETFSVSGMTIRRDLQELADEGRIIRTHGGASLGSRVSFEFRFLERVRHQSAEKDAIADTAFQLIRTGQSILLDSGTTTLAIAKRIRSGGLRCTVVTTSLPIASELFGLEEVETILLGGSLRKDSPDLVGGITDLNLDTLRTDLAFIGADGIDGDGRLYNSSPALARMLQRMSQSAREAYAVVDSSKFVCEGLMRFGDSAKWAGLITDGDIDPGVLRGLQKRGVNVIKAKD